MRSHLLLVPLLASACTFPQFTASKTMDLEIPVDQAATLHCKTHNGGITIKRGDSATTVKLHAKLKVRGITQSEADDNLSLLDIGRNNDGSTLSIFGEYPRAELNGMSPSFTFTLEVPEHLALTLRSHNGGIATSGTTGPIDIETHNGGINGQVKNSVARAKSHNGAIHLHLDAPGPIDAQVNTHNGGVLITLHEDAHGWLQANTHNGGITPPKNISEAEFKRRSLRCRVGEETTEGNLQVRTHNGSIVIR